VCVDDRVAVRRTIDAMQLTIRSGNPAAEACDVLMVPVAADKRLSGPAAAVNAATNGVLAAVLALGDFDGKAKSTRLVHVGAGLKTQRALLVGTGDRGGDSAENGRLAGGAAVQGLSGMTIRSVVVVLPERADAAFVQGLTEGLALASYRFDRYRTPQEPETAVESVTLLAATDGDARAP
jgi:leucyl aminopeptidase